MSSDESPRQAEQSSGIPLPRSGQQMPDLERRSREAHQKMQYLRELRLATERDVLSKRSRPEG